MRAACGKGVMLEGGRGYAGRERSGHDAGAPDKGRLRVCRGGGPACCNQFGLVPQFRIILWVRVCAHVHGLGAAAVGWPPQQTSC